MTPIEALLRQRVFEAVKNNFGRKIELTPERDIIEKTENLISTLQGQNNYETIDINWDNFLIVPGKERDEFIRLDNELLSQGYHPSEGGVTGKVLVFSSTVMKGDSRLLKVIEDMLKPNRNGIYSLTFEGNTVLLGIVTIGTRTAHEIATMRNRATTMLKDIVAVVNIEIPKFKKEIDEFISTVVNNLKVRYQSRNNLYDTINKIK